MGAITYDDSQWPIVTMTFGEFTTEEFREHVHQLDHNLVRGRAGYIFDVRHARVVNAEERKIYATLLNSKRDFISGRVAGASMVTDSMVQQGALTALSWVSPIPFPMKVVRSLPEAELWLEQQLGKKG